MAERNRSKMFSHEVGSIMVTLDLIVEILRVFFLQA